jgi:hypothetical protein
VVEIEDISLKNKKDTLKLPVIINPPKPIDPKEKIIQDIDNSIQGPQ